MVQLYDMAMMGRELLKYEKIINYTSKYEAYLRTDTDKKFWLVNTNRLVKFYPGVDGLKTGFTGQAKYCLTATAKKGNMRVLAVVFGASTPKDRNNVTRSRSTTGTRSSSRRACVCGAFRRRDQLPRPARIELWKLMLMRGSVIRVLSARREPSLHWARPPITIRSPEPGLNAMEAPPARGLIRNRRVAPSVSTGTMHSGRRQENRSRCQPVLSCPSR